MPAFVVEPCAITVAQGDDLAGLETGYRSRGVDVRECDAKRALAVEVHAEEHRLEDAHSAARAKRNSWACRTLGWFCD